MYVAIVKVCCIGYIAIVFDILGVGIMGVGIMGVGILVPTQKEVLFQICD